MSKVDHYRTQAALCTKLAADKPDSRHVQRWLSLAENYELMAVRLNKRAGDRVQRLVENTGLTDGRKPKPELNDPERGSF